MVVRSAGYIAVTGGTLLFLGGAMGLAIFALIWDFTEHYLNLAGDFARYVEMLFKVLIFLANLGGITVILGGWAILHGSDLLGKVLITIGCSTGLIVLIALLFISCTTGTLNAFTASMMNFTGIGTVLAIAAKKGA